MIPYLDPAGLKTRIHYLDSPLGSTRIPNFNPRIQQVPLLGSKIINHLQSPGSTRILNQIKNLNQPGYVSTTGSKRIYQQDPPGSTTGINQEPSLGSTMIDQWHSQRFTNRIHQDKQLEATKIKHWDPQVSTARIHQEDSSGSPSSQD